MQEDTTCPNENERNKLYLWTSNTPYDVRDESMCDLLNAVKTCFSIGNKFKMKYKRKKIIQIVLPFV